VKQRVIGILVFGGRFLIAGVTSLTYDIMAMLHSTTANITPFPKDLFILATFDGLMCVIVGVGLLGLRRWARWLTIAAAGISLLTLVIGITRGEIFRLAWTRHSWLTYPLWDILAVWYFLQPSVKAQFISKES